MYQICDIKEAVLILCKNCSNSCISEFNINNFQALYFFAQDIGYFFQGLSIGRFFQSSNMAILEHRKNITKTIALNCTKSYICPGKIETNITNYEDNCVDSSNDKLCFYPYSLTGHCIQYPCEMLRENQCENPPNSPVCKDRKNISKLEYALSEYLLLLSVVSLIIIITMKLLMPELRSNFSYCEMNCYLIYLISNIFLFVSACAESVKTACILSAVVLHFALMSSFSWMVVIGSHILKALYYLNVHINVLGLNNPLSPVSICKKYVLPHILGHLVPAIFVTFCFICDLWLQPGLMSYGQGSFCWIDNTKGLLKMFIIPSGVLMLVNVLVFVVCVFFLAHFRMMNQSFPRDTHMVIILLKLLIGSGAQWLLGVAAHFYPENETLMFSFILLVSLHGFLILVSTLLQRGVRRKITFFAQLVKGKVASMVLKCRSYLF